MRLHADDLGISADGTLEAHAQVREAGFATLAQDTEADQSLLGIALDLGLGERMRVGLDAERFVSDTGEDRREVEVRQSRRLSGTWAMETALAMLDRNDPDDPADSGRRSDAVIRLDYDASEVLTAYGFVQGTLDVSGGLGRNDRAGLGAEAALGDGLDMAGEVSGGDGGPAGRARVAWHPTGDNEVYLGYSLDPARGDGGPLRDRGRIVLGASMRHSERLTTFQETVHDMPDDRRSLAQVHGVTWTSDAWSFSGGIETATIRDAANGDFDRVGQSLGVAWNPDKDRSGHARLEFRAEDGDGSERDRHAWAVAAGYSRQTAADWRLLTELEATLSDDASDPAADAEHARASLGYAYRPVDNERLNLLFRLSHLRDLPVGNQRGADGTSDGPQQRSTMLSVAGNYDLNELWTLSGKLGHRVSRIADRGTDDFAPDTSTLAALRLDWHVAHAWDLMAEGRVQHNRESRTTETGTVVGLYRHVNDHVSIGIGHEWGNVSDDPAVIEHEARDLFLNVVGRF